MSSRSTHHGELRAGSQRSAILLAEQDRFAANFAEYLVHTEGYDIALVVTEEEARVELERTIPHAVVIDLMISGGRGLQLCAYVHDHFDVPIVTISAWELRDEALQAGAAAFLHKPIDYLMLVATIEDLLGRSGLLCAKSGGMMTDRISSGAEILDVVLGGGLPRDGISLIAGLPGSGKTILARQCVFANASSERPALYLSTVSEPLEKILRYGQTLTFFDPVRVGKSVYYEDLGNVIVEGAFSGVLDRTRGIIQERRPEIIVIASLKALHAYAADSADFRRFLHDLAGMLSAYPVTTLWVGEYGEDEIVVMPEFAVADAILALGSAGVAEGTSRVLQVLKLRCGGFLSGQHAYWLSSSGITVFPRLADAVRPRPPCGGAGADAATGSQAAARGVRYVSGHAPRLASLPTGEYRWCSGAPS